MKINCQWSKAEWESALYKVWKLSNDFEEILNFGLERGFITSSDIIHASDIYKDPNKEYDDEEIKEIIRNRGIYDIMNLLQDEYDLSDILGEISSDDILSNMNNDTILDYLTDTYELDRHDEEVKNTTYQEYINEWIDEVAQLEKDRISNIENLSSDDLHCLICDIIGCGYYDKKRLFEGLKKFKDKLNKNCYGVKYNEE